MKTKRILSLVLALLMTIGVFQAVFAQEQQVVPEQPSQWAVEDVSMANVYQIADPSMFGGYKTQATLKDAYKIAVASYENLSGSAVDTADADEEIAHEILKKAAEINLLKEEEAKSIDLSKSVTRAEVVEMLYSLFNSYKPEFDYEVSQQLTFSDLAQVPESSIDAVEYFAAKGLIQGRGNNTLAINSECTREEILVFAKRAYEHVIYESGAASKGLLWKVDGGDSTVYLLGSVHLAKPDMYPLSKSILDSYDLSNVLVLEANILNNAAGVQYMQQKMLFTDDSTLEESVPEEVYAMFAEKVKTAGIDPALCSKFKPWYAALLLQNLELTQQNYSANLGIDLYFTQKAVGNKNIIEAEGIAFQVDMFDSFSNELQIEFLKGVLSNDEESAEFEEQLMEDMMTAWKSGDSEIMTEVMDLSQGTSEVDKEFNDKVFTERNNNLTEKVLTYLSDTEGNTYFVIFGAGHMVGETGLVNQLQEKGYVAEQIN